MKRMLSISLLLCLTAPFIVTWQYLTISIYHTRQEVTRNISKGNYEEEKILFKFTDTDSSKLYWEHSREFEYNGEMYDVISSQKEGDTILYWCYHDQKETHLKKQREELVVNSLPLSNSNPKKNSIADFFKTLYPAHQLKWKQVNHEMNLVTSHIDYCFSIVSFTPNSPFRPPETSVFMY